jgi:DNA-binding GntR family transcriptional regulator
MTAYERVITHVISKIDSGDWGPGFRLPGAKALGAELGVGPATVNQAYRSLRERGTIVTRRGSGRFVPGEDTNAEPTGNDVA